MWLHCPYLVWNDFIHSGHSGTSHVAQIYLVLLLQCTSLHRLPWGPWFFLGKWRWGKCFPPSNRFSNGTNHISKELKMCLLIYSPARHFTFHPAEGSRRVLCMEACLKMHLDLQKKQTTHKKKAPTFLVASYYNWSRIPSSMKASAMQCSKNICPFCIYLCLNKNAFKKAPLTWIQMD